MFAFNLSATMQVGMANLFLLHTSASLTINENASPDVPLDLNDALDKLAPEGAVLLSHLNISFSSRLCSPQMSSSP